MRYRKASSCLGSNIYSCISFLPAAANRVRIRARTFVSFLVLGKEACFDLPYCAAGMIKESDVPVAPARAVRPILWRYDFVVVGRSKLIMNETFLKSIPRETPYSESSCLRCFFATSESACVASSSSSSDDGSVPLFDSSVARMISYTPLLNSSTMCNLQLVYQLG